MKVKRTLYLDMDGVFVDFDAEFTKRFNLSIEEKEQLSSEEFWTIFDSNADNFFLDAPPFPNLEENVDMILTLCDKYDMQAEILTAVPKLSRYPAAKIEKREWLKKHSPDMLAKIPFNVGPHAVDKQKHCQGNDILLDDNVLNIVQWNARGGIGIFHVNFKHSINFLKTVLEEANKIAVK